MKRRPPRATEQIVQILAAQWEGDEGQTYSLFALTARGKVYRLKPSSRTWINVGHSFLGGELPTDEEP